MSKKNAVPAYLIQMVEYDKLFHRHRPNGRPEPRLPETEAEIMACFERLCCDLSPENLCCDGELSTSEVHRKMDQINEAWDYLEEKLGRGKIVESDVFRYTERNGG